MKFILLLSLFICSDFCLAQNKTKVLFKNKLGANVPQAKIQESLGALLTSFNVAFLEQSQEIDYNGIMISLEGKFSIKNLWRTQPFKCSEITIETNLVELPSKKGYEVRDIPLTLITEDKTPVVEQGVFVINLKGEIEDLYFGLGTQATKITNGEDITDLRLRKLILDFTENFRTAYNRKDIHFLNQVFSDNALIITGKVIQEKPSKDMMGLPQERVELLRQTKAQYIKRLRDIFRTSRYIKVEYDSIEVVRHPALPHIYGVNLVQNYTSSIYSDKGYLFLLIDFKDEDSPTIHVRAWQPTKETSPQDALKLSDFPIED